MTSPPPLTVAEAAARSGFAPSALRFYEREGLITAGRTSGNQRRYERIVLRRLAFIRAARNVGLTLEEVRVELARLPANRAPTPADWRRISRDWRDRLNEKIAAIEALRDRLDSCIGCGCLSLKVCALYNPGDGLAGQTDPRVLRCCRRCCGNPSVAIPEPTVRGTGASDRLGLERGGSGSNVVTVRTWRRASGWRRSLSIGKESGRVLVTP